MSTNHSQTLEKSFPMLFIYRLIKKYYQSILYYFDDINTILVHFKDNMNADFKKLIKLLDKYTEQKDHKYLDKMKN